MAEPAQKPLTLNEFLDWDDGTDRRHEFVDGQVVAMAPPTLRHGRLAQRVGDLLSHHLKTPGPCYVVHQAGIKIPRGQASDFYVADLAVTCEQDDTANFVSAPKLVIEILSPRTETFDLTRKVGDYCSLPSVEEVWLVATQSQTIIAWQRIQSSWIGSVPYRAGQTFKSHYLSADVNLDEIYGGIDFAGRASNA